MKKRTRKKSAGWKEWITVTLAVLGIGMGGYAIGYVQGKKAMAPTSFTMEYNTGSGLFSPNGPTVPSHVDPNAPAYKSDRMRTPADPMNDPAFKPFYNHWLNDPWATKAPL